MPLRDHFHPPLSTRRNWKPFHGAWATFISSYLNRLLPPGYFAEPFCTFAIEIDVSVWDEQAGSPAVAGWSLPAPALTLPIAAATDSVEVRVFQQQGGPQLAGCIELVSPSNKDRPAEREAFVSKCAAYLHDGAGLVLVDIVTERRANLHAALLARISPPEWQETLTVGEALPTLPFCLKGGLCLPLDLEATYEHPCQELRLVSNGNPTAAP
jgi:hypothetical protein